MNFSLVWKIIWIYLKGWRISKMTAVALGPKSLSNSCSRQLRVVNAVVSWSPAGQIDWPKSVFLQDNLTLFETMMTTMNEVNRDKTKVPDNFFFVMFRLSVLLLNSMSKLIHNRCTCKLINIKTLPLHTCMQTNNCVFIFMF